MTIFSEGYHFNKENEINQPISKERAKETAILYQADTRELFEKLESGERIFAADLVFVPQIKPVDYKNLKKRCPAQYVKYYDELRGRTTTAGFIHELELIKELNAQEGAPLTQRLIAGSNQYKALLSVDRDITKYGKSFIYDGKTYELTTAQQIKVRKLLKDILTNAYIPNIRTHSPMIDLYNPEQSK